LVEETRVTGVKRRPAARKCRYHCTDYKLHAHNIGWGNQGNKSKTLGYLKEMPLSQYRLQITTTGNQAVIISNYTHTILVEETRVTRVKHWAVSRKCCYHSTD